MSKNTHNCRFKNHHRRGTMINLYKQKPVPISKMKLNKSGPCSLKEIVILEEATKATNIEHLIKLTKKTITRIDLAINSVFFRKNSKSKTTRKQEMTI